jgi:membrane associated rhomboid family serine protease
LLPVRDIIPTRTAPVVTIALIALNVLAFSAFSAVSSPSLLLPMLLHWGLVHLLVSMIFLWIFGGSVEDRLGHGRFAAFYLLCGLIAAAAQSQVTAMPLIGSGAAISGVLGAYFVLYPNSRVLALVPFPPFVVEIPAAILLALWFLFQLTIAFGTAPLVGPVVGFVSGTLLSFVMRRPERGRVEWWSP